MNDQAAPPHIDGEEETRTREALLFMLEDLQENRRTIEQAKGDWIDVVDSIRDSLFIHDRNFRIVRANRAYAARAGVQFSELIGKPYWEVFPRGNGPLAGCLQAINAQGHEEEEEIVLPTGEIFVSRTIAVPRAHSAEPFFLHIMQDVTERRIAAERALQAERRFRALIENASDLVVTLDEKGTVTYISPSALRIGGYVPDELMGRNYLEFAHPDDRSAALASLAEILANPDRPHITELRFRHKDGHWLTMGSVSRSALGDPAIRGVIINSRDITERKRAEHALRRANRALRTLSAGNEALVRATDEKALLTDMCRVIVEAGGYQYATVGFAKNDADKSVTLEASFGLAPADLSNLRWSWADSERGRSTIGTAIRTGLTQIARNPTKNLNFRPWWELVERMGIASMIGLPLRTDGAERSFGALSIGSTDTDAFDAEEVRLLTELASDLSFGVASVRTRAERRAAGEKLYRSLEDSIQAIAATVEVRDPYTAGHQRRVADLAAAIAREMGLPEEHIHGLHLAGTIHDLGKIAVPAEILAKPGKLSAIEFSLIQGHAQAGYDILKDVDFPWPIARMVLEHHERLDGSGYPQGLKGEAILLESRVLAVADVVEAMSSHRPYRPSLGVEPALAEIERGRGTHYEARAVDACLTLFRTKAYKLAA